MPASIIPDDRFILLGREGSIFCDQEMQDQTRERVIQRIMSGGVEPWQYERGIIHLIPGRWPQFGSWEDATRDIARDVYECLMALPRLDRETTYRRVFDWAELCADTREYA